MMSNGFIGPYKDYILAFYTTPQDPKKKKEFKQCFPHVYEFMTLDDENRNRARNMARGAAIALLGMPGHEGAPKWLKEALSNGG